MRNPVDVICLALATVFTLGFSILVDGALDTTFDTDGMVLTTVVATGSANGVAIQPDGKIVSVGSVKGAGGGQGFGVVRYNSDGSLDTGFDTDGKLVTQFEANARAEATCVALQSDGKIVVAGFAYVGAKYIWAVARYNTDGSLDTGFDTDGKVTIELNLADDRAYAVAIQADGKIVVTGYSQNGTDHELAVVRYNSNGSMDNSFDTDGMVTTAVGSASAGQSIAIQGDGKIVVGGYGTVANNDFLVVRYNSNGTLDTGFDADGIVTTPIGSGADYGAAVGIQADGKIVLAGYTYTTTRYQFALARYSSTGALDAGFDTDGKVTTSISASDSDYVYAMALQLDGKIVVGGLSENGWDTGVFALARYNSNGTLDTGFDGDGKLTTSFGGLRETVKAIAIQSDGKIVAAGEQYNVGYKYALARYTGSSGPLPVEIVSFEARLSSMDAVLHWTTASETNNYGFEIERASMSNDQSAPPKADAPLAQMNNWSKIGFVEGTGNSNAPREYSFADKNLGSGVYSYRLKQIDRNGSFKYTESIAVEILVPRELMLSQNYPNPFNPSTTIEFSVPEDGRVSLGIFDALGREVATLVNGPMKAGVLHQATFDASKYSSGIYFARLQSGEKMQFKKLLLLK